MPIDIPKSRDEFMSMPIDQQRLVVKKLEFMSMPIDQQRDVVAKLENAQQTGAFEAAARGFGQGLTFNTLDEIIGSVKGGVRALGGEPLGQSVEEEIELARRGFRKAERDQPFATGAGQVAGSVLPAIAAPAIGASKLAAGSLLGAGAKAVIPKTAAGRLGAGVAAGGLAGAGKSEEGVGSEEFRHSVQAGMAGGALGQAGFGLGKLVVGKTGKMAGGLTKAMGMVADKASKAGFIPKAVVGVAKKQIPGAMAKGFDKAIKLMEAGDLPANQAGILMQGLQSGGAGLATAYINLINNDVEFARAVEAGEVKPSPGKLGDFVPKAFTEKSDSTFSGRLQAGIDELFGVDQIGLDPGEKPFKGQPTDDDRIAMTLVPLFAGITKKVTSLNPEKIKELLEKKGKKLSGVDEERLRILNKPGMSEARKDKLINQINEGIKSGKQGSDVTDLDIIKRRMDRSVGSFMKKQYDMHIDMMSPKSYFKFQEKLQKISPGDPGKIGYEERLKILADMASKSGEKKRINNSIRNMNFIKENPKLAKELNDIDVSLDLVSEEKRSKLLQRRDEIWKMVTESEMPQTKGIIKARSKIEKWNEGLPSDSDLNKMADYNYSTYRKMRDLKKEINALDEGSLTKSKITRLNKMKKEAMAEYQEKAKENDILEKLYRGDDIKPSIEKVGKGAFPARMKTIEGGEKGIQRTKLGGIKKELENLQTNAPLDDSDYELLSEFPTASIAKLQKIRDEYQQKVDKISHREDNKFILKAAEYWLLKKGDK